MQALLHTLTKLLLHHMLDAFLLEFARNRHIGVDLRRSAILHRQGHLVETLEQWVSLKIIVQQHPPQVWMASEPDAKEIIGLALQPVRGLPDRNNAIHLRLLVFQPDFQLQKLVSCRRTHMIHRFKMIKHINTGYTA